MNIKISQEQHGGVLFKHVKWLRKAGDTLKDGELT